MMDDNESRLQLGISILEREIVGITLYSGSRFRNWVLVGTICTVTLIAAVAQFGPVIKVLIQ